MTLYSPAMMDIKHLHTEGLLRLSRNVYQGVVAVTNDDDAYSRAISKGRGRPDLLVPADINKLLVGSSEIPQAHRRRFLEKFPFSVVNLDYTGSIFWEANRNDVSLHISALQKLIDRQRTSGAARFALCLTTTAEQGAIAGHFLATLEDRIAVNLTSHDAFATRYEQLFSGRSPTELRTAQYDEFVPLGLVKFVTNLATSNGYELVDCETAVILRAQHRMLHVACHFRIPGTLRLRGLGRQSHLERRVSGYLDKRLNDQLIFLDEAHDKDAYLRRHARRINRLVKDKFELDTPEPEGDS